MNTKRIALVRHYLNSLRHNKTRLIEVFIIPIFEILSIGFLSRYIDLNTDTSLRLTTILLVSIILWHLLVRLSSEVSQQFFDDFLTRNLIHLLGSPITIKDLLSSLYVAAGLKLGLSVATIILVVKLLYGQSLTLLPPMEFIVLACLVLFFWALALGTWTSAFFFLFGNKAGMLSWGLLAMIQPVSGVFYQSNILPPGLQQASLFTPTLYIFEGLRAFYNQRPVDYSSLWLAMVLSLVYLLVGVEIFGCLYQRARRTGFLARL